MKHWQDDTIEFRLDNNSSDLPYPQRLVVYNCKGTTEDKIAEARKVFFLGPEWKVVRRTEWEVT